jgi:hypothetical protein
MHCPPEIRRAINQRRRGRALGISRRGGAVKSHTVQPKLKNRERRLTMKANSKQPTRKTTTKKVVFNAPVKASSMTTARLAANHNETLVRIQA